MARYTGPRSKKSRAFGEPIFGVDKAFEKKNHPPGQHGLSRRRKASSEYGMQLKEKQKAKYTYGLLEKQFRNLFVEASRRKGITGENLLQLLESRLDNVVFRLGIAPTRRAARQLVSHRHIEVNGKPVNIPSYTLRPGDSVNIRAKSGSMENIKSAIEERVDKHAWLEWDIKTAKGIFLELPERQAIPENINEQLIVELYSK